MDFGANSGYTGLQNVGYTSDGVEVTITELSLEVKSDRYGGEQGAAIDKQMLGMEAEIRLTMTEFDPKMFNLLEGRMVGSATIAPTPGRIITPGTLSFANGGLIRVLLYGVLDQAAITGGGVAADYLTPKNFPFCTVTAATSKNLGSKHARANVTLKAYQGVVGGNVVLWNQATA
jgi:hypothetical protein